MRYYFVKDRVETGDVVIENFPTEEMLGEHLTKPLQGALFRKFMAEIMNITDDLDMGEMGMGGTGLKMGSCGNCITILILYSYMSVLGIVIKWEVKMMLRSDPMEGHITVHTMPLYWRKERGHGRLGVTLA